VDIILGIGQVVGIALCALICIAMLMIVFYPIFEIVSFIQKRDCQGVFTGPPCTDGPIYFVRDKLCRKL